MRGDESRIDEYKALKKSRAKLVKMLQSIHLSTFKNPPLEKVEPKCD
jgi:hypothetical protein